jgi:hypothetical protein
MNTPDTAKTPLSLSITDACMLESCLGQILSQVAMLDCLYRGIRLQNEIKVFGMGQGAPVAVRQPAKAKPGATRKTAVISFESAKGEKA